MTEPRTAPTRLADYRPPDYRISSVDLAFDLDPDRTRVVAELVVEATGPEGAPVRPLVLDGEDLELVSIAVDGRPLSAGAYTRDDASLTIAAPPRRFRLTIETAVAPAANTRLEGLYLSSGVFCTQCEAEGFRRITYFLDRPDVLARYRTTLRADRGYRHLLSNGNLVAARELDDGRHEAVWDDPFPKPAYLFALVAGDLAMVEDTFRTAEGRDVRLRVLVEHGKESRASYAIDSLKRAMRWDEETYGLAYDLDVFHIVAVSDFNMGAMENKSLNVFNDKYVLADPETATDQDYAAIEAIVAHEYFHNWTGNRITCRDWFQLSLKEGLTVFRDQQFTAAMRSPAVKRIQDVRTLRARQFPEDAGPLAHPVRPAEYVEINNFYTATVYEKGAEVIGMLHTLLGAEGYRRGIDLYVARHDGTAATCDDFVQAMADATGRDLGRFMRWYSQAGTPVVTVAGAYDAGARAYTLDLAQHTPPTPGQPDKAPLHLPLRVALIGTDGPVPLRLEGENAPAGDERLVEMTGASLRLRFADVPEGVVPSVNRGFSAPVQVEAAPSEDDLATLMAAESDPYARWNAAQDLATRILLAPGAARDLGDAPAAARFVAALDRALAGGGDPAFLSLLLALPGEDVLAERQAEVDIDGLHTAREALRRRIANGLGPRLSALYEASATPGPYSPDADAAGRRALRNAALSYLAAGDDPDAVARALAQYRTADNMTDRIAALRVLADLEGTVREDALADFHARWKDDPLVLNKWLSIQALADRPDTLDQVTALLDHPAFAYETPNKVYALIGGFTQNQVRFHAADGAGYAFLADQIERIDPRNPQLAARLAKAFTPWRRLDAARRGHAEAALRRLAARPDLSRDSRELVERMLAG